MQVADTEGCPVNQARHVEDKDENATPATPGVVPGVPDIEQGCTAEDKETNSAQHDDDDSSVRCCSIICWCCYMCVELMLRAIVGLLLLAVSIGNVCLGCLFFFYRLVGIPGCGSMTVGSVYRYFRGCSCTNAMFSFVFGEDDRGLWRSTGGSEEIANNCCVKAVCFFGGLAPN